MVVAMNVAEDFDGWLEIRLEQNRLCTENLLHFSNQVKNLLLLNWEGFKHTFSCLALFGLKQVFDEDRVK